MTYHVIDPIEPMRKNATYSHFAKSRQLSRHRVSPDIGGAILKTHLYVLRRGEPTMISSLLPNYQKHNPEQTQMVIERLKEVGVVDEYMVPVFGPHSINAVISFGFNNDIADVPVWKLEVLASASLLSHNKMIQYFKKKQPKVKLSDRERVVLKWIARGKSNAEIGIILGLSKNSIDTYVRRVFEKFSVNDRVSAAVRGLLSGAITP